MSSNLITKEDMDSLLECPFCTKKYTLPEREPKVLKCGHTFCLDCLNDLIKYIQLCPECNKPVEESISQYPTNYVLVKVDKIKDTSKLQFNKELPIVQTQIDDYIRLVTESITVLERQSKELKPLSKALRQCTDITKDDSEMKGIIEEINIGVKGMGLECNSRLKAQLKADFALTSIDKKEFINTIVQEIYRKKVVYAFNSQWYNEDTYWGRLSYEEGKLCIHSFTTKVPPASALFVSLTDLKKCLTSSNFEMFIDFRRYKHIYTLSAPTSKSTLNFIKLCTGEDGSSFKQLTPQAKPKPSYRHHCTFDIEKYKPKTGILNDYEFLQTFHEIGSSQFWHVVMSDTECSIETNPPFPSPKANVATGRVILLDNSNSGKDQNSEGQYSSSNTPESVSDCGIYINLPMEI